MGQTVYCFLSEWAEPIKEFVLTLAAVVGVVVAVIGLTTWRKQLGGTAEYELAKRLLREVYQFREALQSVRFPFISAKEMELSDEDGLPPSNDKDKRYRELAKAYQTRYFPVNNARNALEATLLEVEVLWGNELLSKVRALYKWDGELYTEILNHLDAITSDAQTPDERARTKEIIYSKGDKSKDKFLLGLHADIQDIERDVKPHLKRFI